MEAGPMSGGRVPGPLTGPQSGVYASTLGGGSAPLVPGQQLHLTCLPVAGDEPIRVACEGPLSLRGRPVGAEPLRDLLGPRAYSYPVLLSLERVGGAETSGVSWLFQTGEKFAAAGGRLVLFAVPPPVLSLIEMLQMDLPFRIAATEADARALALTPPAHS